MIPRARTLKGRLLQALVALEEQIAWYSRRGHFDNRERLLQHHKRLAQRIQRKRS